MGVPILLHYHAHQRCGEEQGEEGKGGGRREGGGLNDAGFGLTVCSGRKVPLL